MILGGIWVIFGGEFGGFKGIVEVKDFGELGGVGDFRGFRGLRGLVFHFVWAGCFNSSEHLLSRPLISGVHCEPCGRGNP